MSGVLDALWTCGGRRRSRVQLDHVAQRRLCSAALGLLDQRFRAWTERLHPPSLGQFDPVEKEAVVMLLQSERVCPGGNQSAESSVFTSSKKTILQPLLLDGGFEAEQLEQFPGLLWVARII